MTHKVHPKAFRIKGIEDFNVRGFYHGSKMRQYLQEDFLIKDFLNDKFSEASIANIEVEHTDNKINIIIETARPGLIIGRGGQGADVLKKLIEKLLEKSRRSNSTSRVRFNKDKTPKSTDQDSISKPQIKIDIREVKNPWTSAMLVAQWAAKQIEKRIPFRQVLKRGMERVMQNKEIKGIKMEVSGRLNGIEIARKEWLKQGRMPLQTLRADIDYAQTEAYCTYGVIGVKVWIYKGEKFE